MTSTSDAAKCYSRSLTPIESKQSNIVTRGEHEWVIEGFIHRKEEVGESISTTFKVFCRDSDDAEYESVWKVKAYPKGCNQENQGHLSVFLSQISGPELCVIYTITLVTLHACGRDAHIRNQRRGIVVFPSDRRGSSRGWKKFAPLESITAPGSTFLHDEALVIRCRVDLEMRYPPRPVLWFDEPLLPEPAIGRRFLDALKFTDVVLEVTTAEGIKHEYACHKFQLAQKSDVFDAMFSNGFKESQASRVPISGLAPEAVLEMLRFIYTGKVQDLDQVSRQVLSAADMYNMADLKELCEKSMCEQIRVENVISVLLFAQARFSKKLKMKCIRFITKNVKAVTHSDDWNELAREPTLMTEVVRAMGPRI